MGVDILLGVRSNSASLTTIKINDFNIKLKVEDLRKETATRTNLKQDAFDLIYCGCILENDVTLESYGLKNGAMVHILQKEEVEHTKPTLNISEEHITKLAELFKAYNENPVHRSALHRVSKRPEVIDNIISSSPGLYEDSVAIAMLQDPHLMAHFVDVDTVRRIAKAHPLLLKAAQNLALAVYDESKQAAVGTSSNPMSTSQLAAYSYSLENLSDDEEMAGDSSQSSDSAQPGNASSTPSCSAITTAQLAAALSRAGARTAQISSSSSSASSANNIPNPGVITTEMFSQAMQQAFASTPPPTTNPSIPPILPPMLPQFADLQRQLAQMHEMGLQDDTINVQALQFTNGDVQAAIELVFSGFSDN
ncbi:ubiquitin-like protein 7 [Prorops nasuta]|uniref:ubiquitin-like protein 7 n=1 Tax=Prorops nasuta TaxID=863751 RepID=UPI0034CFA326